MRLWSGHKARTKAERDGVAEWARREAAAPLPLEKPRVDASLMEGVKAWQHAELVALDKLREAHRAG